MDFSKAKHRFDHYHFSQLANDESIKFDSEFEKLNQKQAPKTESEISTPDYYKMKFEIFHTK